MKLGTIFEKIHRSTVILKIVGANPQLDQNFEPTKNLREPYFYIYLSIYWYSVQYILKRNKKKTAQRAWTPGRFLSAACWFSFIFSSSFLIFTFPSYNFVFLILLSFFFFFVNLYVLSIYRINFGFLVLAPLGDSIHHKNTKFAHWTHL